MTTWLGVDVGGRRKRFDVALVDERRLLTLAGGQSLEDVVALVKRARPAVVGIDSPRVCARPGETTRDGERELARRICGIRWTPDEAHVRGNPHYDWIVQGLALFAALASYDTRTIEVFPTASWTRWQGPRAGRSRTAWSREGLAALGLDDTPTRTNQDQRDAIAAAVTARQHDRGETEALGGLIVVPAER